MRSTEICGDGDSVHGFTRGSIQNGMLTSTYFPKLAVGKAFGRFNVQSVVSGVLPTGKIALQGRAVEWNLTGQVHAGSHVWLDVENNAMFNNGELSEGKTQNIRYAGGLLYGTAQGVATHASRPGVGHRHANCHLRIPHLQPQPHLRAADYFLEAAQNFNNFPAVRG